MEFFAAYITFLKEKRTRTLFRIWIKFSISFRSQNLHVSCRSYDISHGQLSRWLLERLVRKIGTCTASPPYAVACESPDNHSERNACHIQNTNTAVHHRELLNVQTIRASFYIARRKFCTNKLYPREIFYADSNLLRFPLHNRIRSTQMIWALFCDGIEYGGASVRLSKMNRHIVNKCAVWFANGSFDGLSNDQLDGIFYHIIYTHTRAHPYVLSCDASDEWVAKILDHIQCIGDASNWMSLICFRFLWWLYFGFCEMC